jgi:hypothetical protein
LAAKVRFWPDRGKENTVNLRMPRLTNRFRESAISVLLFALVALGWFVALRMPDQQVKDEQYQQNADDSGGQDAWLSSLTH